MSKIFIMFLFYFYISNIRRKRKFLGIRSHPSFVKAITIAFETSASSMEGLLRSGEGESPFIKKLIKDQIS